MSESDQSRRREATVVFKRALKAGSSAIHRTQNRVPRGKGWVQCVNAPAGVMCRPERVRAAIALFAEAYQIFPDIVALNQMALFHEILGEFEAARGLFVRMREQATAEELASYVQAADIAFARMGGPES